MLYNGWATDTSYSNEISFIRHSDIRTNLKNIYTSPQVTKNEQFHNRKKKIIKNGTFSYKIPHFRMFTPFTHTM